jgi:5-methylcytosine-specific restriction endonuclease McrA
MVLMGYNAIRGNCDCGQLVRSKGRSITGKQMWDKRCWKCRCGGYRQHKKDYCESCGFVALHAVQLDVDHIDGNRHNNHIDNLQTLCANCHRLKTQLNNDHLPR